GGSGDDQVEADGDPDGSKSCVPADERFSKCRICGDRFLMFYDNDEEEWMYRNACYISVKGDRGSEGRQIIVHKLCLDVSGLMNREEITWRDLMPGTPRQRKRPADGDD
ncbi:unnamed protein product, partial [Hapterophycus canaliculatus]